MASPSRGAAAWSAAGAERTPGQVSPTSPLRHPDLRDFHQAVEFDPADRLGGAHREAVPAHQIEEALGGRSRWWRRGWGQGGLRGRLVSPRRWISAQAAWALSDDGTRGVLELCQDIARDKTLAWLEESVAQIRWGSGGKHRAPVKDGLIIAVFRHYESRSGNPLLHDHAVVSIKSRRPDGKWGNV
ncbi:relaxase domain-containing protein [Streptomyces sp. NPDC005151]